MISGRNHIGNLLKFWAPAFSVERSLKKKYYQPKTDMFTSSSRKRAGIFAIAILASLAIASSARAQLNAYDGFNYPAGTQLWGTIAGQGDGGTGWGSTWSATSAAISTNFATGLSYGSLVTSGGGVVLGNPGGSTATTASSERLLSGTLGSLAAANPVNTGTIWISFLYQNWQTSNGGLSGYREAKLGLFSGATLNANGSANVNGSEKLDIGTPNTYAAGASDTLSLYAGSTFVSSGVATPRGSETAPVFLLLELTVDQTTANDTAYLWVNPAIGGSAPDTGTAISFSTADLSSVNALRGQAANLNASGTNAVFEIDELRVGDSFFDVAPVPEPATMALFGMGAAGMALLIRRRGK